MKRWLFFGYGLASYGLFFALYAYMAGFVGGFAVPKTIDSPSGGSVGMAVAVNLLLLAVFGLQHSVMARPGFKRVWTRIVPQPIERSTYMYASTAVLVLLMWAWRGSTWWSGTSSNHCCAALRGRCLRPAGWRCRP